MRVSYIFMIILIRQINAPHNTKMCFICSKYHANLFINRLKIVLGVHFIATNNSLAID